MIYSDGTIITASLSDYGPGFLPMGFPYRRHPFVYYIEALSEMEAPKGDGITAVKKGGVLPQTSPFTYTVLLQCSGGRLWMS